MLEVPVSLPSTSLPGPPSRQECPTTLSPCSGWSCPPTGCSSVLARQGTRPWWTSVRSVAWAPSCWATTRTTRSVGASPSATRGHCCLCSCGVWCVCRDLSPSSVQREWCQGPGLYGEHVLLAVCTWCAAGEAHVGHHKGESSPSPPPTCTQQSTHSPCALSHHTLHLPVRCSHHCLCWQEHHWVPCLWDTGSLLLVLC